VLVLQMPAARRTLYGTHFIHRIHIQPYPPLIRNPFNPLDSSPIVNLAKPVVRIEHGTPTGSLRLGGIELSTSCRSKTLPSASSHSTFGLCCLLSFLLSPFLPFLQQFTQSARVFCPDAMDSSLPVRYMCPRQSKGSAAYVVPSANNHVITFHFSLLSNKIALFDKSCSSMVIRLLRGERLSVGM
jgi:hypothetical protein